MPAVDDVFTVCVRCMRAETAEARLFPHVVLTVLRYHGCGAVEGFAVEPGSPGFGDNEEGIG